jgi:hypothetical protein
MVTAVAVLFISIWSVLTTLVLLRYPSALRLSVRWGDRELRRRWIWSPPHQSASRADAFSKGFSDFGN